MTKKERSEIAKIQNGRERSRFKSRGGDKKNRAGTRYRGRGTREKQD